MTLRKSSREKKKKVDSLYEYEFLKNKSKSKLLKKNLKKSSPKPVSTNDYVSNSKDTKLKETKVKDTKVKDTRVGDTEVKDMKSKDTKVRDVEVKDTRVRDVKDKKLGKRKSVQRNKFEFTSDDGLEDCGNVLDIVRANTGEVIQGDICLEHCRTSGDSVADGVRAGETSQGDSCPKDCDSNIAGGLLEAKTDDARQENIGNVTDIVADVASHEDATSGTIKDDVDKEVLVANLHLSPVETLLGKSSESKSKMERETSGINRSSKPVHDSQKIESVRRSSRTKKCKIFADMDTELGQGEQDSSGDEYQPFGSTNRRCKLLGQKSAAKGHNEEDKESDTEKSLKGKERNSKVFCCPICGKMFRCRRQVLIHEQSHTGNKPHSCPVCGKKFVLKSNMKHHEQLHSEDKSFMCEVCGKCFKTHAYCKAHQKIHETDKPFKCVIPGCEKSFSVRRTYHIHQLYHRGEKPFKCTHCGKSFRRKSDLYVHASIHSDDKQFRCSVCQKRFSHKYAYNAHLLLHKTRPFNCRLCKKFFAKETDKVAHEQRHKLHPLYHCELCNREKMEVRELVKHIRKIHNTDSLNQKCSTCRHTFPTKNSFDQHQNIENMQFNCAFCDKVLSSACELYSHRSKHRQDKTSRDGEECNMCNVCGRVFRHQSTLVKHKLDHESGKLSCSVCGKESRNINSHKAHVRIHSGEKPFGCDTCGKSFSSKSVLYQHGLIHTGVKPHACEICQKSFRTLAMLKEHKNIHGERTLYRCELCGKEYASRTNYKNHVNVHKGVRNYECEICGKKFFAKYVMRKHKQIHTGQKNYQCEFCGKEFIQHGNWLIHRRSHTGEKPHGCEQCPASFVNSSQLKAHVKRVHDQKKEFMCDKCFKHFYDRRGLQAHMRNIHLKKENGQIYHCGKCDKVFAVRENHHIHESSCTGPVKILPSLRPSILQNVLKKVYSESFSKIPIESFQSQSEKRINPTQQSSNTDLSVLKETTITIAEPVQVIQKNSWSRPVPCPVQQFQVLSVGQDVQTPSVSLKEMESSAMSDDIIGSSAIPVCESNIPLPISNCSKSVKSFHSEKEAKISYISRDKFPIPKFEIKKEEEAVEESLKPHEVTAAAILGTLSTFGSKVSFCKGITTANDDSTQKRMGYKNEPSHRDSSSEESIWTEVGSITSNKNLVPKFQCNICRMCFESKILAKEHRKLHRDQLLYQCSLCEKRFGTAESLTHHLQSHFVPPSIHDKFPVLVQRHSFKDHTCTTCYRRFLTKGLLKLHKDSHRCGQKVACKICGMKLHWKMKLDHHKNHCLSKYECKICRKTFLNMNVFKLHEKSHEDRFKKCKLCSMKFIFMSTTKRHQKSHDKTDTCVSFHSYISTGNPLSVNNISPRELLSEEQSPGHSASKQVAPSVCSPVPLAPSVRSPVPLAPRVCSPVPLAPIIHKSTEKQTVIENFEVSQSTVAMYTCDLCCENFSSAEKLSAHNASVHVFCNVKYLCQICNLHFQDESVFTNHIKLHGEVVLQVNPEVEEVLELEEVQDTAQIVTLLNNLSQ